MMFPGSHVMDGVPSFIFGVAQCGSAIKFRVYLQQSQRQSVPNCANLSIYETSLGVPLGSRMTDNDSMSWRRCLGT